MHSPWRNMLIGGAFGLAAFAVLAVTFELGSKFGELACRAEPLVHRSSGGHDDHGREVK